MVIIDARLKDGRSALCDLEGTSPGGGLVTTESRNRVTLTPGDVIRDCGEWASSWAVVADVRHNGISGITNAGLVSAEGQVWHRVLTSSDSVEVRTDTRIDPETLYKLLP